jgi:hypothetical protein
MNYKLIDIPEEFRGTLISGDYINQFDRETAKRYFQWYMSIKNERIITLEKAVQTTKRFEAWKADLSIKSLIELQYWFEKVVEKRPTTEEEKKAYMSQFSDVYEIIEDPIEWTLRDETESLCHDVGIYFAEMLMKNNPHLIWRQDIKSKSVDRNWPIVSANKFTFNPYTIASVSALKILDGEQINLEELFTFWDNWAKKCMTEEKKN